MHAPDPVSAPSPATVPDGLTAVPDGLTAVQLDHLAIAVRAWPDSYERFVGELGGRWGLGGPSGDFAPYQLVFGDGLRLEFVEPRAPGGSLARFLERRGPAAHHITFKTPSLDAVSQRLHGLGFETFGDRPDLPVWRELFIHPKKAGLGTLLQVVQSNDEAILRAVGTEPPDGFPTPGEPNWEVALFGLTTSDLTSARALLVAGLGGSVSDLAADWFAVTWGRNRSILVRTPRAAPGGAALWADAPDEGPAFLVVGPAGAPFAGVPKLASRSRRMPHDARTGIPVWLIEAATL